MLSALSWGVFLSDFKMSLFFLLILPEVLHDTDAKGEPQLQNMQVKEPVVALTTLID